MRTSRNSASASRRRHELDVGVGAVGTPDEGTDVRSVVAPAHVFGEAQRHVLHVVGVDQREAVDPDEIARFAQQHPVEARGGGDDGSARIDDRQTVVGMREQQLQVFGIVRSFTRGGRAFVSHA